jgi:flavin-dependent dehydrogenase
MSIAPTLQLEQAADRCWDVVIIGAGPAGATAARQLAQMGKSVLLVDKASFPRWKVCGCCLNAGALATLRATGLGRLAARSGAVPLQHVELAAQQSRAVLPLPGGAALSREVFDAALVRAAIEAGAAFLPSTFASLGEDRRMDRRVILRQAERRQEVTTRLVLAAVGLDGQALRGETSFAAAVQKGSRIGAGVVADRAPAVYRAGTIYMACGTGGYLGLVRREDGRLNLAAAFDVTLVKQSGGPGCAAATILDQVGWPPVPDLSELAWRGTPGLTRRPRRLAGERILVLGDAAGYIEPFTGEGIAWALTAGTAVAPLASRAVESWRPEWAERWTALYASLVARRQRLCRLAVQVLRRPALVRMLIAVLAQAPGLARPFLRQLAGKVQDYESHSSGLRHRASGHRHHADGGGSDRGEDLLPD